jgi:hypothetical protein
MSKFILSTPVTFIIFNRPDTTQKVFNVIKTIKPNKLFVVADGPRSNKDNEFQKCKQTRDIINQIDWECEVYKNYSDVNLGCMNRIISGLDWVFENTDETIILEDDIIPNLTFFRFCQEILDKYREDERIMMVSGNNFQFGKKRTTYSYYFSYFPHIWGWATWKRAWEKFDSEIKIWPELRDGKWLNDILHNKTAVRMWHKNFERFFLKEICHNWDVQWVFACWVNNGLTILPNVNLTSNIGFGKDSTHTNQGSIFSNLPTQDILFPIVHPPYIIRDSLADDYTQQIMFSSGILYKALVKTLGYTKAGDIIQRLIGKNLFK